MIALIFWIMEMVFCIVAEFLFDSVHLFDSLPSAMLTMAFAVLPALIMEGLFAAAKED